MRKSVLKIGLVSSLFCLFASNTFAKSKPLYKLPQKLPEQKVVQEEIPQIPEEKDPMPFLVGTDTGLYRLTFGTASDALWTESRVERIYRTANRWYFLTDAGIYRSDDLVTFTPCNEGLPSIVIKSYDGKQKTLTSRVNLLKDIASDPENEDTLVTATKDAVYLSRDGGQSWKSIGSSSRYTAGIKAVACAQMDITDKSGNVTGKELVVFMSHAIYGFSYYRADAKNPVWVDVSGGFECMKSLTTPDEISDIVPVIVQDAEGNLKVQIYIANSYLPNIYTFDWKAKRATKIYSGPDAASCIDCMWQSNSSLLFSTVGDIQSLNLQTKQLDSMPDSYKTWKDRILSQKNNPNCAFIPKSQTGFDTPLQLGELWLLTPETVITPYGKEADKKKSVYASAYQLRNDEGIAKYKKIVTNNKLNSIVVDMKDDYGLLRFTPKSQMLKDKGTVTAYKIDVEKLVKEMKDSGIYLIARIVVFKDKNLATYDKGQYAVWDSRLKRPWLGVRGTDVVYDENGEAKKDANGNEIRKTVYYDENWVDPYSEEVWEYNIEIAKELVERGFDEIQFDYIRFPTDGKNMADASFRWKDKGMDKESALYSFLAYARENIKAPIGVDIYGANGWYRSGTRTGQDVELMSRYVDVICPMFYPSHFEQTFMEYAPTKERPYRIYFHGSFRNTIAGRNRIIVRPWVQAFYMNVRYDKYNYDKDYVSREIYGVRDGLNRGYMYWNNSGGNYDDIRPDIAEDQVSPWEKDEAALQKRLPAFGAPYGYEDKHIPLDEDAFDDELAQHCRDMISIYDSMLLKDFDTIEKSPFWENIRLLQIPSTLP